MSYTARKRTPGLEAAKLMIALINARGGVEALTSSRANTLNSMATRRLRTSVTPSLVLASSTHLALTFRPQAWAEGTSRYT